MSAMLPEDIEAPTVAGMCIGQVAYVVPWAMWVDGERTCWLHPNYKSTRKPFGTYEMRIERRPDGYHVWPPPGATWQPRADHGYASADDLVFIPVAKLHRD